MRATGTAWLRGSEPLISDGGAMLGCLGAESSANSPWAAEIGSERRDGARLLPLARFRRGMGDGTRLEMLIPFAPTRGREAIEREP